MGFGGAIKMRFLAIFPAFIAFVSIQLIGLETVPVTDQISLIQKLVPTSNVVELQTLEQAIQAIINTSESEMAIISVSRPDCSHCVALAPYYQAASKAYAGKVAFYKMAQKSLRTTFASFTQLIGTDPIDKVPTLFFFKNGKLVYRHIGFVPQRTKLAYLIDREFNKPQ